MSRLRVALAALAALLLVACALATGGCRQPLRELLADALERPPEPPPEPRIDPSTVDGYVMQVDEGYYPWWGVVDAPTFQASPGDPWYVDFELTVDLTRLAEHPDVVEALTVALVGERIHDADGYTTGLSAITITPAATAAGVPLSYYEGTLPVRALGNRRGSPLEATVDFPAGDWAAGGLAELAGRLEVQLPDDLPAGFYRPHVEIFARIPGSNTAVDLGHLPYQLGQWLEDNLERAGPAGRWTATRRDYGSEPMEFMRCPQVLPSLRVGDPARPRVAWSLFHGSQAYGQSGLLSNEDQQHLGLVNRVRYPTPLTLLPGAYDVDPTLPTLFPEAGLAGVFIGEETVTPAIMHHLDLYQGSARAALTGPDGATADLGTRWFRGAGPDGPRLSDGGFRITVAETGHYTLTMVGEMVDTLGRRYDAGGTYEFDVAYPLSFSTPVKPGTNFLQGARFPASAHVNPPVPADVRVEVTYVPQSDESRAQNAVFEGTANRYGHFTPEGPALAMDESGEYRSLVIARWTDPAGNLWQGAQASAGVVADREPLLVLHGGRTYVSPPHPDKPDYGGWERYQLDFEGGSSYLDTELLSQFDHVFPYHSGDTLHVATTYPFESVVGIVLSQEATTPALARRLADAYNPGGEPLNYPTTPRWRTPSLLPDVFKLGEDNFGYYRISAEHADHLPILSAHRDGLHPYQYPDGNELEAYTYLSVIRPGFSVLSLAFSGSFMGPCWIVSPNPYGGQINASPNGDLPGDLYRVMAGMVVRDHTTGRNYYDAYSAAIAALPPGSYASSVTAPGERPLMEVNGRAFPYFMGMDTSDVYAVGEPVKLGGTVMPPTATDVSVRVTGPDGEVQRLAAPSNRLGGFVTPEPVRFDQPGAYRVHVEIERDGIRGDVPGSGDGEFFHFAIPEDDPPFVEVPLPPMSRVAHGELVEVPLRWPADHRGAKVTYSAMIPGLVLDEGERAATGNEFVFRFDPAQFAVQYPIIDTVDHANGAPVQADTIVLTFLVEATLDGEPVFDAVRVILRGPMLFNPRPGDTEAAWGQVSMGGGGGSYGHGGGHGGGHGPGHGNGHGPGDGPGPAHARPPAADDPHPAMAPPQHAPPEDPARRGRDRRDDR